MARLLCLIVLTCGLFGCETKNPISTSARFGELVSEPIEIRVERRAKSKDDHEASTARLTLTNAGTEAIELSAIESSCACTVAELPKNRRVEPGKSLTLNVTVHVPDVGSRQGFVRINSTASKTPTIVVPVHLKGDELHPPYFLYEPKDVELIGNDAGNKIQTTWSVATFERRSEPSWILGVEPIIDSSVQIELEGEPSEKVVVDDVVERQYSFLVTAVTPSTPDEDSRAYVTFRLSQPSRKSVGRSAVTVKFRPLIRLAPDAFHIDVPSAEEFPIRRKVVLISEEENVSAIRMAENSPPWFSLEEIDPKRSTQRSAIPLSFVIGDQILEAMKDEREFESSLVVVIETSEKKFETRLRLHFRRK